MKASLNILLLGSILAHVTCDIWSVPPLIHFDRPAMNGRWWTYKWLAPAGINENNIQLSRTWTVKYEDRTETFHLFRQGRYAENPYVCARNRAAVCPAGPPGVWSYKDSLGQVQEMKLVQTDYVTYKVIVGCMPRFEPGCRLNVDVRTRMPFAGPRLRRFLDKKIKNFLCLNPNKFVDVQRLSRPYPVC